MQTWLNQVVIVNGGGVCYHAARLKEQFSQEWFTGIVLVFSPPIRIGPLVMKSLLNQIALIVALAVITGLVVHGSSLFILWNSAEIHAAEAYAPQPVERGFVQQWQNDGNLIVDARSHDEYQLAHIPTAYSVAAGDLQALKALVDCCLNRQQVVVYCSGFDCTDSFTVGEALYVAGFSEIYLYEAGFSGWQQGENE